MGQKEEIMSEIETQLFLIQDASQQAYDLLDKYGEALLPFEYWFNLRFECKKAAAKFENIGKSFEKNKINILNMKRE